MASAPDPPAAAKPALSSKLMGLKFMQRAAHKAKVQEEAERPVEANDEVGSYLEHQIHAPWP
jgi:hypothetical protein